MIRLAQQRDISKIGKTYADLLTYEQEHGSASNWRLGVYPTTELAARKVSAGTMYVLEEDDQICASMILNGEQGEGYDRIDWQYEADGEQVLVIHTLCVPPQMAGRGYGTKMIAFAKEFALLKGCSTIRIDTYAHNEPAKKLYLKNGFRLAGSGKTLLQGLIEEEQVYLECRLDPNIL